MILANIAFKCSRTYLHLCDLIRVILFISFSLFAIECNFFSIVFNASAQSIVSLGCLFFICFFFFFKITQSLKQIQIVEKYRSILFANGNRKTDNVTLNLSAHRPFAFCTVFICSI